MRVSMFTVLSLLLSVGAVAIPLQHASAQDAPPPAAQGAPAPASEVSPPPAAQGATPPVPQSAPPPAAVAPAPPQPAATVTHRNVNLRGGPGTNYALIRLISAGSAVDVKECKNGWCQVAFQGTDGYIIESSIAPNASGTVAKRRFTPLPGYASPPPAYVMRLPGYYPARPYPYYYYSPYYPPYWAWRRTYWRGW